MKFVPVDVLYGNGLLSGVLGVSAGQLSYLVDDAKLTM